MGRAKIAMEFIKKEKTRNATYVKRKKGLLKKSHEFSILCSVPICIILCPYKEGKQSLEVEVYSFKGDNNETASASDPIDSSRATNPEIAREIIGRYLRVPKEERNKRALNLCDMFDEWTRKADQDLFKLRQKCALAKYSSWDNYANFDGFNVDQLLEVLAHLDQKIDCVKQRISTIINGGNGNGNGNDNHNQTTVSLMPYYYFEPTPISSLMIIPSDDNILHHHHHQHQKGCPEFEGVNQFPLFDYPIINNNNQGFCHQMVPFDHQQQSNAFIDQVGASRIMDDHHQIGSSNSSSSNLVMYNMNMMYDVSAMYYDQGSGMVDNVEPSSSSYGGDLHMTMPLQLPVLQHNVSLPMQISQYHHQQMFYN